MDKLTDEQIKRLPEWALEPLLPPTSDIPELAYREITEWYIMADEYRRLAKAYAHALEKVAAAELMAEALERIKPNEFVDVFCPWCVIPLSLCKLDSCDRLQALAAWKACNE